MTFDINKYETTTFNHVEVTIAVPELKDFFGAKDKPEWIVRGLTGTELAITNEAVESNKNIEGVLAAIVGNAKSEKISAITDMLGLPSDSVPNDMVRRFSMLVQGSVKPICQIGRAHV